MVRQERFRIQLDPKGNISWNRGGDGMSLKEFVATYPCKALKFLAGGGRGTEIGDGLLSVIGGLGNLDKFNRDNMCGEEDNLIQQI